MWSLSIYFLILVLELVLLRPLSLPRLPPLRNLRGAAAEVGLAVAVAVAVAAVLGSGVLFPSSSALPSYPSDEE